MPDPEKKRWYEYVFDSLDFLDVVGGAFEFAAKVLWAFVESLF